MGIWLSELSGVLLSRVKAGLTPAVPANRLIHEVLRFELDS